MQAGWRWGGLLALTVSGSWAPSISSTDTELFRAIERNTTIHFPDAALIPGVAAAFTDSHFFREIGITSYGFFPILIAPSELRAIHGNNERISIEDIEKGAASLTRLLIDFATNL